MLAILYFIQLFSCFFFSFPLSLLFLYSSILKRTHKATHVFAFFSISFYSPSTSIQINMITIMIKKHTHPHGPLSFNNIVMRPASQYRPQSSISILASYQNFIKCPTTGCVLINTASVDIFFIFSSCLSNQTNEI